MNTAHPKKVKRALVLSGGAARGAFQVGVIRYLEEIEWRPDLVCGASIGAIHAAALGSGMTAADLSRLWRSAPRKRLRAAEPAAMLRRVLSRKATFSLSDAGTVREILLREIDFDRLRHSDTAVALAAVDVEAARTVYFSNEEISVDHVLASAAAPVFFPWRPAAGRLFYDGGLMANTPVLPALQQGAEQVVAVLLSPVGAGAVNPPASFSRVCEVGFEMLLAGPFQSALDGYRAAGGRPPELRLIAPPRMLGFLSLGNYSRKQVDRLTAEGYEAARQVMGG